MDQLNTDVQALQTAVTNVVNDVAALPTVTDPNDAVVASMVSALESAGWTVTPPEQLSEPELPAGDEASS